MTGGRKHGENRCLFVVLQTKKSNHPRPGEQFGPRPAQRGLSVASDRAIGICNIQLRCLQRLHTTKITCIVGLGTVPVV
jgi:hypothetical protein